jgi:hypothetical protein
MRETGVRSTVPAAGQPHGPRLAGMAIAESLTDAYGSTPAPDHAAADGPAAPPVADFGVPDPPHAPRPGPGGSALPPASSPRTPADRSTWERLSLHPDVELHVRRPLDRATNRRVDQLERIAKELFDEA